ncbi:signal transduction histidine kinase [Orbus hercynius]|uniref:histidine kinase n=1 Tax=Orbus hercynius TaxID=593135 RepID=A0A495REA8_9GAMM|nr:HAMP domain-containing sensor histidine kinase [Orbus hercynius]RKS85749.1 signal transduction histidine kinase [Orbus hercynius]
MKKVSIRTRITLWYTIVLMIFLALGVAGSYNAMYDILLEQHRTGMQRGAHNLARMIAKSENPNQLSTYEKKVPPRDVYFAFFNNQDEVKTGQYENWMLKLPKDLEQIRTIEHNDLYWFIYDYPVNKDGKQIGWVRTTIDTTSTFQALTAMREQGILSIIPCLLLAALGGFLITRWALKPIKNIAKAAKEIGAGDLSKRIKLDAAKDEIGELLTEFNHMADNLQNVIEREKQFSADASHEMRTPIAVIITNAEYAIESQNLATCTQTLALIINKSRHMQQMLSQLMILARGNEQAQAMEIETLDISSVITDIAEERSPKAEEKQITIHVESESDIIVNGDLMLLSRMITNLIDNGVQYGKEGGYINIDLYKEGKHAVILVVDNGIGIAASDLPFIFDRFYRADKSRSQSGSGLGLSFVDFIIKLHKGHITVDSHLGKGTCFRIELPLA